jgi:hypothetical protein
MSRQITDLEVLWAIRDIPSVILNTKKKGILAMFVACIGMHKNTRWKMKNLENRLGGSERRLRDSFHDLEELGFLIVVRPKTYKRGETNEYYLDYEAIIEAARRYKK